MFGVLVLVLAGLSTTEAALAQLSVGHFGQMNVNAGLTQVMNAATLAAARQAKGKATDADLGALRYRPTAKTSNTTKRALIALVGKKDKAAAKQLSEVLDSQDVIAMFGRDMAPYGLQLGNVGDALTAYLVANWMIINQTDLPKKEMVVAVKRNISGAMGASLGKLTNEQRQTFSELLIYQTMFAIGSRTTALGKTAAMQKLSDQSHQGMLAIGIDMRKLALTSKGLLPK